jgi:hypothetical protein
VIERHAYIHGNEHAVVDTSRSIRELSVSFHKDEPGARHGVRATNTKDQTTRGMLRDAAVDVGVGHGLHELGAVAGLWAGW